MDAVSYAHSAKQAKRIKKFIENPDSNSGVITVPKVIEAGESVTVPAGRVAVLPNVQVDGTLNIEGEVFIPAGASFSKVVETEGNQNIDGVKTFIESPIVPTPINGNQAVNKDYVDNLKTIAMGTATFNSVTNNINLIGIGIGVEIGDVIQISGAEDVKNNSEFTVEVITDDNNIIVNQGHANKGTSKNVVNKVDDTNVTVKLLAKYYNAPPSLGRDMVSMLSSRSHSTNYVNNTGREMIVSAEVGNANTQGIQALVDGKRVSYCINTHPTVNATVQFSVPKGSIYLVSNNGVGGSTFATWYEVR